MKISALVIGIVFILVSIIELVFCFLEREKPRKILKLFCISLLSIVMILLLPSHPLIYVALIASFIGDVLLLSKNSKLFILGASFFFISHLLNFCEVATNLLNAYIPFYFYIIISLTILMVALSVATLLKKIINNKYVCFGAALYLSLLLHNLIIFIMASAYNPHSLIYIALLGYALFLISDAFLIKARFKKDFKRRHFVIMLTYLLAQSLIALGFYLTYCPIGA